jgi:peptidylprolyl isomerase
MLKHLCAKVTRMLAMSGRTMLIVVACAGLGLVGCGGSSSSPSGSSSSAEPAAKTASDPTGPASNRTKPKVVPPKGPAPTKLVKKELIKGTGAEAKTGDEVTVQYVGVGYKSGTEFDSSWSRKEPFSFTLGAGEVIRGWDVGVAGMRVGGRRELITPPNFAYGSTGTEVIAPGATLVFVIDLLAVK